MKKLWLALLFAVTTLCSAAGPPPMPAQENPNVPNVTSSGKGEWTPIHLKYAYAPGVAMLFKNSVCQGVALYQIYMMSPLEQSMMVGGSGLGGNNGNTGLGNNQGGFGRTGQGGFNGGNQSFGNRGF